MADEVIDLAALLAPLPTGEAGAGVDLREDFSPGSPYQKLRDARAEARAEERAQDAAGGGDDVGTPHSWRDVKKFGIQVLQEKSKDFEVAAWLTEALVRLDGLPGLSAGAKLLEGLLDKFWEGGLPLPEEDVPEDEKFERRSGPIGGLAGDAADGTVMQPLRRMPLFKRVDGSPVGLHLWTRSEDTAAIPNDTDDNKKRKAARLKAGDPPYDQLQNEARADVARVRMMGSQARAASRAWTAMDAKANERFGYTAPSTRRVTEVLGRILEIGEKIAGTIPDDAPKVADDAVPEGGAAGGDEDDGGGGGGGHAMGKRALRTRDDAIKSLEELAEYFRKTEPHSPLAYTLDHAVRRARLPLPDLLAEVLPDDKMRTAMLTMLGIKAFDPPPEPPPAAPAAKK